MAIFYVRYFNLLLLQTVVTSQVNSGQIDCHQINIQLQGIVQNVGSNTPESQNLDNTTHIDTVIQRPYQNSKRLTPPPQIKSTTTACTRCLHIFKVYPYLFPMPVLVLLACWNNKCLSLNPYCGITLHTNLKSLGCYCGAMCA